VLVHGRAGARPSRCASRCRRRSAPRTACVRPACAARAPAAPT